MIEYVTFTCALVAVGYFCFRWGQSTRSEPSEAAMMERLIDMRSGMLRRSELDEQIETAARSRS